MKYRIRDFAWLTLAIGIGLGWYVDRNALSKRLANSIEVDPDYQFFEPAAVDVYSGYFEKEFSETEDCTPFEVRTRDLLDQGSRSFRILDSVDENSGDLPEVQPARDFGWKCGFGLR